MGRFATPTASQIGVEPKKRPFTQSERPFVLQLAQGYLSALEQALVHPSIVGQDDSRLTLYISLRPFRKILVIGTHAFRFGPVICTFYFVAVVHLRQLYAHHVAGFGEVAHFHNGVLAAAEGILSSHGIGTIGDEELLAGVGDLVFGGRLHLVAKHGFDFGVSFRQQPGFDQRVGALLALAAQHVLIRQGERQALCRNRSAHAFLSVQVCLYGLAEVALVRVLGAAARGKGKNKTADGRHLPIAQAGFHESADSLVPQVVKAEVFEARCPLGIGPCFVEQVGASYAIPAGFAEEHLTVGS